MTFASDGSMNALAIFDIGGSFHSLTYIFGGSYLNVGQDTQAFTINPFSCRRPKTTCNLFPRSFVCSSRATASVIVSTSKWHASYGMA